MSLARNQYAVLRVAKTQLQLADDDYRDAIRNVGGAASGSAKDLTLSGFNRVMDHFRGLGFKPKAPRPKPNALAPPTPRQMAYIRRLFDDLGWEESERRRGFVQKMFGVPWPQTRKQASLLAEALKGMIAGGRGERKR